MTLEVETIVAVSLMMAVFSAVAAVGTSIVLGAGFERLRAGFEVVRKQTGFFSDAIRKLEQKVETVDEQTNQFTNSIHTLEEKVTSVGEQAGAFKGSMEALKKKVEIVDKQTGFFSTALHTLEEKLEKSNAHEEIVAEKLKASAENDLISTGKADALVSHAEDLLTQMGTLASHIEKTQQGEHSVRASKKLSLSLPKNLMHSTFGSGTGSSEEIFYH